MNRLIYNILALAYRIGGRVPDTAPTPTDHTSECPWCYRKLQPGNPIDLTHLQHCHRLYCCLEHNDRHTDEACEHYANALYAWRKGY